MHVLSINDGRHAALSVIGSVALIYSLVWNFNLGPFLTQGASLVFAVVGYVDVDGLGHYAEFLNDPVVLAKVSASVGKAPRCAPQLLDLGGPGFRC